MTMYRPPETRGRAAVYGRRSHWEEGTSLSVTVQGTTGRRLAESLGYTVGDSDIYLDDGISGMTDDRAAFRAMMLKVFSEDRPYKAVVVTDISRLSRNSGDYIDYEEMFAEAAIELVSPMDPPANPQVKINTHRRMKAVMNEAQLVDAALKTRQHQMFAVEMGFYIGWIQPLGYRKKKVIWRGTEHTKLERDPETWHHLLHVIDMGKTNHTLSEIRQYLTASGVKQAAGEVPNKKRGGMRGTGEWNDDNVSYLLKHDALLGWTSRGGEESGSKILHKSDKVICRDAHEAAMTEEDRKLIVKNLASRRIEAKNSKISRSPNLMADLTSCGMCGATMRMHTEVRDGKAVQRLICANRRDYKKGDASWCPNPSVRLEILVERILATLLGHILTPKALRQQVNLVARENKEFVTAQERRRKQIGKHVKQLEREIDNIVDATAGGKRNPAYDRGIERRQKELDILQGELEMVNSDLQGKLAFVNEPGRIIENALDRRTYLESDDQHSVREMLKSLIRKASILNRTATVEYTLPLPRNGTDEPIIRDTVPLDKKTCLSVGCAGLRAVMYVDCFPVKNHLPGFTPAVLSLNPSPRQGSRWDIPFCHYTVDRVYAQGLRESG